MPKHTHLYQLIFSLVLILLAGTLYGQQANGATVSGKISSVSGNAIEGVNVVLVGENKGVVTGKSGYYTISNLAEGIHTLQISYLGFKTITHKIQLNPNQNLVVDFKLEDAPLEMGAVQLNGKSKVRKINEQAYTVTSVSTKELLNSSQNAQQILDRVPSVRVLQEGGLGSDFTFSLNGFKGNQVKFFLNGIPMDNFGSSFNLNNIPVNSIERIDVYNGVVPIWLGTDALGGAVNIITNQKDEYLDVSYSYGSFNTHQASVNGAYTNDETGFTVRGNLNYNYSDNNYDVLVDVEDELGNLQDSNVEIERFHDQYQSASAQIETGFVDKNFADQLLFGVIASEDDSELQTGATMATVFGAVKRESQSIVPSLKYKKRDLFAEGLDVNVNASYSIIKTKNIDTLTGFRYNWYGEKIATGSQTQGEQGEANLLELEDKQFSNQFNLSYLFDEKHSFSLNQAFQYFTRDEFDQVNTDVNQYFLPKKLSKNIIGLSYKYKFNEKWTTTIFGKAYSLNVETSEETGNNIESTEASKISDNNFGYGIATSYFLTPALQVKASFENTFRLPTAEEFFGNGLTVLPNPNLKPEQGKNFNLGASYNFQINNDHQFDVSGTFLYRDANDLIYNIVTVSGPTTTNGNLSKVKALGAQGSFAYRYKEVFNLSANITYQDITDEADLSYSDYLGYQPNLNKGARIPNTPYLFGSLVAGLNFKDVFAEKSRLNFNYYFNFTEEYFLSSERFGRDGKAIIPRQLSHSLEAVYSLENGKYNISVECRNVTDEELYDNFRLQKPGRAFYVKLRYSL
ncbi:TonB-dependent receptor [Mesonia aquimarina]|uniref:TonB-dependent receptor n=1 Tax=Mesonia aquimarina TaxID=1504967 RepID=UPI001968CC25|nr:TonB-dependent receptor [Mesonia aquimarina]